MSLHRKNYVTETRTIEITFSCVGKGAKGFLDSRFKSAMNLVLLVTSDDDSNPTIATLKSYDYRVITVSNLRPKTATRLRTMLKKHKIGQEEP